MSRESPKDETDIEARLELIGKIAGDDEAAHAREDELHQQVLTLIAEGKCPDPLRWSELALKTQEIEFERWCA